MTDPETPDPEPTPEPTPEPAPPAADPPAADAKPPKPKWSTPTITSYKPIADAEGIAARPGDGLSNLS